MSSVLFACSKQHHRWNVNHQWYTNAYCTRLEWKRFPQQMATFNLLTYHQKVSRNLSSIGSESQNVVERGVLKVVCLCAQLKPSWWRTVSRWHEFVHIVPYDTCLVPGVGRISIWTWCTAKRNETMWTGSSIPQWPSFCFSLPIGTKCTW